MLQITLQVLVDDTNYIINLSWCYKLHYKSSVSWCYKYIYDANCYIVCPYIHVYLYKLHCIRPCYLKCNYNSITWVNTVNYNYYTLFLYAKLDLVILQAKLQVLNLHFWMGWNCVGSALGPKLLYCTWCRYVLGFLLSKTGSIIHT